MNLRLSFSLLLTGLMAGSTLAQDQIRLNQIGFYPEGPKTAVIVGADEGPFSVVSESGETAYAGQLGEEQTWDMSGERVRIADFSELTAPGDYVLMVPGIGSSYRFSIAPNVHESVAKGSIKGFYFQRMSTALLPEHAGKWARAAGHPDDRVEIHPSAASASRPAGSTIAAPKGWYDAGDYNKYIVNSGITMGTLLSAHEDFPDLAEALDLNIPESGNATPDLLDEIAWNLRWMLAMQDPEDGGVYTKLTSAHFTPMEMPEADTTQRYVVQKSTPAALDLAAVAAQAARVYAGYTQDYPGLADSARTVALSAWKWARANPDSLYNQRRMNEAFEPDVSTGAYGDWNLADNWAWAAVELFITTGADSFLQAVELFPNDQMTLPSWANVHAPAMYSLVRHGERKSSSAQGAVRRAQQMIIAFADSLVTRAEESPYVVPIGHRRDFIWGSNSVAANQSVALVNAYLISNEKRYLNVALANLDYILGRNATGYSFVTGFGARPTMNPHHRQSEADGVVDPIPGLLAGGPNPGQQDGCTYPATEPARAYVDDVCSYASNEIAINWNAPLVYLTMAVEAGY